MSTYNENYRFWLSNTVKATLAHCSRLAATCNFKPDAADVSHYITDLAEGNSRGECTSPFPESIRGRLRNRFQPKHLMLKLASLRDAEAGIDYEFLVEYGLFEPSTGIYFGIKAVADSDVSSQQFISRAEKTVDELSSRSPRLFSNRRLRQRPLTDNADNGSYWPVWLPSPDYHDLNDEIRFLHKLYRHFKRAFPAMTPLYEVFGHYAEPKSATDETPLAELTEKIASIFSSDECPSLFRRFITNACRLDILADCGNGQWRFNRHWELNRRGRPLKMTKKAAFDLTTVLFAVMARRSHTTRKRCIPWKQLRSVLLDSESQPFDDGWQRQKPVALGTPYYRRCEALCMELMGLPDA